MNKFFKFDVTVYEEVDNPTRPYQGLVAATSLADAVNRIERDFEDIVSVTVEPWEESDILLLSAEVLHAIKKDGL